MNTKQEKFDMNSIVHRYSQNYLASIQRLMSSLYGHATSKESDKEFRKKCNELLGYMMMKYSEISFPKNSDGTVKG